jgi:hypothetical protein
MTKLTFENMAAVYPELQNMREEARRVDGSDPHFCANAVWYSDFKPRVLRLVGFEAPRNAPDWMTTPDAYDVAYQTIYNELPYCRDCACL